MSMTARRLFVAATVIVVVVAVVGLALATRPSPSAELKGVVAAGAESANDAFASAGIIASRACVFGPYTTEDAIADELGFQWTNAEVTVIERSDGHELVVAAEVDRVIAWTLVTRPQGSRLLGGEYGCQPIG